MPNEKILHVGTLEASSQKPELASVEAIDKGEYGVCPVGGFSRSSVILGVSSRARKGFDTTSSCERGHYRLA